MKKSLIEEFFYFCAVTVPASFPSDEMGVRITWKIREISHILSFISKKTKKKRDWCKADPKISQNFSPCKILTLPMSSYHEYVFVAWKHFHDKRFFMQRNMLSDLSNFFLKNC